MRQLTFTKKNTLEWWNVPGPMLHSPGEALVRPFVAARCDGDVIPLDHNRARLEIAQSVGANPVEVPSGSRWYRRNAPIKSGQYPISVDASASISSLVYALRSLSPGGVCTSVGFYFEKRVPLPLWHMFVNSSTLITGASNPRADLPDVLRLISSGKFQPEKITTLLADWDDAADALLEHTTKVVVQRPPLE